MRYYKNSEQSMFFDKKTQRFHNGRDPRYCIDVWSGADRQNQQTTFWSCHGGRNQKWSIGYSAGVPKNTGFTHGQTFKVESRMSGHRVLTGDRHIGRGQYSVVLALPTKNNRDTFYFDAKIGAIRWKANRHYILSIEYGPTRRGRRLVLRAWKGGEDNT